jgi:hypothetical protein
MLADRLSCWGRANGSFLRVNRALTIIRRSILFLRSFAHSKRPRRLAAVVFYDWIDGVDWIDCVDSGQNGHG